MQKSRTISADHVGGLAWLVFGGAIVCGSWTMDRLESLQIPLATVPGLVPGLLGLGLMIFGMVLLSRRAGHAVAVPTFDAAPDALIAPDEKIVAPEADASVQWMRAALSGGLCLLYGLILVGHGLPYWGATALFLFLHILLLDETEQVPARFNRRRMILALVVAGAVATVVSLVFRYIFLVRLP